MDELPKKLGEKIKSERLNQGWSQEELADVISVSQGTISNFERGERIPDIFVTIKLNMAFETDITDDIDKSKIKIFLI